MTVEAGHRDLPTQSRSARSCGTRELEFVPRSGHLLDTYEILREQREIRLSFVDAAVNAIARDRGAKAIAKFDENFGSIADLEVVPG